VNATAWERAKSLLADAADLPPDDRERFVVERCPDPELRREVLELLGSPAPLSDIIAAGVLPPGARLGPYLVERLLGRGGMGEVYKARDTRLDRTVAIKVLPAHLADDPQFRERFAGEARAISQLDHPHICALYDVGEQDGTSYLVMQYLEGETLGDRLKTGALPLEQVLHYGMQIADALEKAHSHGITHRDIKPGNIFVTARGHTKLLDFGLARRQEATGAITAAPVTEPGSAVGTIAYMSPEQARGEPVDARSDLWSVGVVLYEMVTGSRPFDGPTSPMIFDALLNRTPQPVRERNPNVPAELERVIDQLLEKDRARRYASAAALRDDLERLRSGLGPAVARGRRNTRLRYGIAATAGLIVAAGGLVLWQRPHAKPLTDQDVLVLADFVNTTGDPIFDGTLRQGLAIQLEQSPFLKIMDDQQVQQGLRLMSVPAGGRITNQIAHDICVRDAVAATIDGSIASLGRNYVITLQAITCQSGATLAREQIQAADKEHVLTALGTAAAAMRAKLGESRASIQTLNRPLEQATTPSLDALQSYTAGYSELSKGRFLAAVPLLERAITLDPNFATAYAYLGIAYNNAGETGRQDELYRKAFSLIDRASREYERDLIAAGYYQSTGELDRMVDVYRSGTQRYPSDWGFRNNLSGNLIDLGQFEEGLKEGLAAVRLQPNAEPPYRRVMDAYMCLDQLDEANKVAERVRMQGIDGARIHQRFLEMAYIEGDQAAVERETLWYAGKREEYLSFGLQAANRNVLGRRLESSKLYKKAADTALRQELRDVAASFDEANARADALSGNCRTVRRLGRPALALAMCGDTVQAEKLVAEISKRFPKGTVWNAVQLPEVRAALELQHDPRKAVELLASASRYERAYPEVPYLRGSAYLNLHRGAEAAAEFQKIVDHKGASWGSTWLYPNWGLYDSLSHLGMARGFALAGDTAKARRAFQDFFTAWKGADTDIPILRQAEAEFAKLR
jgi:serine/threonine protein kinase/tetratricopeptide (TPR) repeat protein